MAYDPARRQVAAWSVNLFGGCSLCFAPGVAFVPDACARFLVPGGGARLLRGCWGSAAPPWALVVVAVPGVVSGRCSVRRPPRCHVRHRCIGRGGVGRWHVGHLCLFPELHRRVRHPTRGPCGGFCTTRGCDTPATRRQRASCSAKPPSHQIGDRAGRNSRRRRCGVRGIVWARLLTKWPPHQVASSPRRRQGHLSTNFACNSPTVRIDASSKTAEFQRSDFKT